MERWDVSAPLILARNWERSGDFGSMKLASKDSGSNKYLHRGPLAPESIGGAKFGYGNVWLRELVP